MSRSPRLAHKAPVKQVRKKKTEGGSKGGESRWKLAKFCLQPHLQKALTTKRTKKKRHKQTTQQQAITAAIRQERLREMTKCFLTRFS